MSADNKKHGSSACNERCKKILQAANKREANYPANFLQEAAGELISLVVAINKLLANPKLISKTYFVKHIVAIDIRLERMIHFFNVDNKAGHEEHLKLIKAIDDWNKPN